MPPELRTGALIVLSLGYAVFSVRPQPPGMARLLLSMPLFLLFSLAPLHLQQSVVAAGMLGFMFGWLANFKLLAYTAGRGPLALPGLSAPQWLLVLLLPYFPAKRGHGSARAGRVALAVAAKLAAVGGLTAALLSPASAELPELRHACYALYIWLVASLLLDAPMPLGCRLLNNIELQPAMVNPFASTSLREFWGRRYNQIVSSVLMDTVYTPILEGRWLAASHASCTAAVDDCRAAERSSGTMGAADSAEAQEVAASGGLRRRAGTAARGDAAAVVRLEGSTAAAGGKARAASALAGGSGGGGAGGAGGGGAGGGGGTVLGGPPPSPLRRWLAVAAAFVVSGFMHEVCILYMCGGRLEGSFRMLGFFLAQPALMAAQEAAHALLLPKHMLQRGGGGGRRGGDGSSRRGGGGLGVAAVRALQVAGTAALLLASAEALFWGPFEACGLDERGLREIMGGMERVGGWLRRAFVSCR